MLLYRLKKNYKNLMCDCNEFLISCSLKLKKKILTEKTNYYM